MLWLGAPVQVEKGGKEGASEGARRVRELLLEAADVVVVDEAHEIKNEKTQVAKTLAQVRVCCEGCPTPAAVACCPASRSCSSFFAADRRLSSDVRSQTHSR